MASEEQAKIKLYWLNESRAQRIVWLLEELKLDYDIDVFHRNKETQLAPPELERVHPLGKSPVITVTPAAAAEPIVLAESGFMTQYLVEHFPEGQRLMPKKWKDGQEGKIGGETDMFLRYQYLLHYCEGSLMPPLVMGLVLQRLRSPDIPFFIRPITSMVAGKIFDGFIFPNVRKHLVLLDQQLSSSGGDYLCGTHLTAADILISFPLIAGKTRLDDFGAWEGGSWQKEFPRVLEYLERLKKEDGYVRSVEKIKEMEGGEFSASL